MRSFLDDRPPIFNVALVAIATAIAAIVLSNVHYFAMLYALFFVVVIGSLVLDGSEKHRTILSVLLTAAGLHVLEVAVLLAPKGTSTRVWEAAFLSLTSGRARRVFRGACQCEQPTVVCIGISRSDRVGGMDDRRVRLGVGSCSDPCGMVNRLTRRST
jgi:hypothetical protein